MMRTQLAWLLALAWLVLGPAVAGDGSAPLAESFRNAPRIVKPESAPVLAATRAGDRIVAVGDYGIVIFSEDGRRFRQATKVPTRSVLTSVFFIDAKRGWATGHDGTVIATADGGDTWHVLREEPGKERALLSVWFQDPQLGLAVGQFGLVVATDDGGKTWRERRLVEGELGDRHLLHIFPAGGGLVFIAAEAGAVFRSEDYGSNWKPVQTDNKGSFWTGLALKDGTLLVAGMRGHIYRSVDRGVSWKEVLDVTQQSLTAAVQRADGAVRLVGLSGTVLSSRDQGQSFEAKELLSRTNLSAIVDGPAGELLFSLSGLVAAK